MVLSLMNLSSQIRVPSPERGVRGPDVTFYSSDFVPVRTVAEEKTMTEAAFLHDVHISCSQDLAGGFIGSSSRVPSRIVRVCCHCSLHVSFEVVAIVLCAVVRLFVWATSKH